MAIFYPFNLDLFGNRSIWCRVQWKVEFFYFYFYFLVFNSEN